jgi:anaerobic ribonucleoside-triphosphate reductase activating protein
MKVAGIIKNSVVNGVGVRDTLFLQGCPHHCKGCHNPQTWAYYDGEDRTVRSLVQEFADSPNQMTISGGEPLLQYLDLVELMWVLNTYHGKRFWLYTGYRYDQIAKSWLEELSHYVDVLVDGRFVIDKKDLTLPFRGSSNQRLIDLPKSVAKGEVVLWEGSHEEN